MRDSILHGKIYEEHLMTGWPKDVTTCVNRAIGQYSRYYKYIYIGISVHPRERFAQHLRYNEPPYDWERCIVVYKTTSEKNVNMLEGEFIHDARTVNKSIVWSHEPENKLKYLYIMLANKPKQ